MRTVFKKPGKSPRKLFPSGSLRSADETGGARHRVSPVPEQPSRDVTDAVLMFKTRVTGSWPSRRRGWQQKRHASGLFNDWWPQCGPHPPTPHPQMQQGEIRQIEPGPCRCDDLWPSRQGLGQPVSRVFGLHSWFSTPQTCRLSGGVRHMRVLSLSPYSWQPLGASTTTGFEQQERVLSQRSGVTVSAGLGPLGAL